MRRSRLTLTKWAVHGCWGWLEGVADWCSRMSFLINPFAFLAAGGDFESIATVTVGGGGAASIEFTSIPAGTYQHLQLRLIARQSNTYAFAASARMRLNGDTGSNYNYHELWADGSSVYAGTTGTTNYNYPLRIASASQSANVFGVGIADFLDYADTSKNTVVRSFTGYDNNGSGVVYLASNLWLSTAAVTTINLTPVSGNFVQYSEAALYGIKA
jgi:hypothetical protein